MTQYGYRIFAVELYEGAKQKAQPFGAAQQQKNGDSEFPAVDYRDIAVSDVKERVGKIYSFGIGYESGEDAHAGEVSGTSMRFTEATRIGDRVRLKLEHGVMNADGILVDPREEDSAGETLRGKSTLHNYRACLVAKEDSKRAVVAVEARGRSCPIESVLKGLHKASSVPWRLRPLGHVAGQAVMEEFIRTARIGRVQFDKWSYSDDGARERREVSMSVLTNVEGETVRDHVLTWMRSYFGFEPEPWPTKAQVEQLAASRTNAPKPSRKEKAAARKELNAEVRKARAEGKRDTAMHEAQSVKEDIFVDQVVDIDFNDVGVELSNGDVSRTVRPTTDFRRFTYALGHTAPTDDAFFRAAEATAASLLSLVQDLRLD